ncbi:hypothetical protein [Paraburkholderia adhaesiva]|uniref:hypothetical protein n=1 Tax=Paraburkholderia adhaesiva TaxID=2883244 RepID=UPI001F21646D|nr:hypothetical protein [Paraburkholderia adhaesiva]
MKLKRLILALSVVLPVVSVMPVNAYADMHSFPPHTGDLVTLQSRPDATQPIYIETETQTPTWVVLDFPGGGGDLSLSTDGPTRTKGNFTIRTASYWIQQGDATVMVDTPSDFADGATDGYRMSKDALKDAEAIVAEVHKRFPGAKVALISTSRGTISVANIFNREPELADAYILTSPVSVVIKHHSGLASVHADHPEKFRVLYVGNKGDVCIASPYTSGRGLAESSGYPFIAEESHEGGGDWKSDCEGHSPHGYLGIEPQVMNDINAWPVGQQPAVTQK